VFPVNLQRLFLLGFGAAALAPIFGGSFAVPFYISALLCGVSAIVSLFVLKRLVRSRISHEAPLEPPAAGAGR